MVTFKKKSLTEDLMPQAIEHLENEGVSFNLIDPKKADEVSKANSRALVLMAFEKNESGFYQITVKDKSFYSYTRKFLSDPNYCRMRILDTDPQERTVTAETSHLGVALDIIEILGAKYNLSIVDKK